MTKRAQLAHYFQVANPFRSVDSLNKLVEQNLIRIAGRDDIVALNKPPGFVFQNKKADSNGFIDLVCHNLKQKLNWEQALRFPLVSNEESGLTLIASNHKTFKDLKKTLTIQFPSSHVGFLKFYGITTAIPLQKSGNELIDVSWEHRPDVGTLFHEEHSASHNRIKANEVSRYQIEYEMIDSNTALDVALFQFKTAMHGSDAILLHCVRHLCPLLGDHKYSSRVKTLMGHRMLAPDQRKESPQPQVCSNKLLSVLKINQFQTAMVPLHLHLHNISLPRKFRKQSVLFECQAESFSYFKETLCRLDLKLPSSAESESNSASGQVDLTESSSRL